MTEPGTTGSQKPDRILILGIGKSGTTALMSAICQATGLPHVMEPDNLRRLDYTGSFVAKKLIDTLGDHELRYIGHFDKVIIIVRDPRDALISRLLYRPYGLTAFASDHALKCYLDLIDKKIADPKSVSVQSLIRHLRAISRHQLLDGVANANARLLAIHETHGPRALLLKYEDFIRNDYAAVDAYLGTSISSAFTVAPEYGRVSRKGGQGDWKHWFTAEDRAFFDIEFAPIYATFGYAPEAPSETPVIDRATSADYVIGIVNEWRARRGIAPYNPRFARFRHFRDRPSLVIDRLRKSVRRRVSARPEPVAPGDLRA